MGAEVSEADAELIEKVRDLTAPSEDGESRLERACRAADASAQLTEMKYEMARVLLAQSAEIARLREALEPFAKEAAAWDDVPGIVHYGDDLELWQTRQTKVCVGDLRRARAALEAKG